MNSNSIPHPPALATALAFALAGCASHSQTLPARTPPAGLRAGYAQTEVATLGAAARERVIRSGISSAATAAFKTSAVHTLFWHAWFRVPVRGSYDIDAKSDGRVLVFVDHHDAMIVRWRSNCPRGRTAVTATATGTVALAGGWHEISGDFTTCGPAAPRAKVSLSIRAPGAAAAVPLVPYWPRATTH